VTKKSLITCPKRLWIRRWVAHSLLDGNTIVGAACSTKGDKKGTMDQHESRKYVPNDERNELCYETKLGEVFFLPPESSDRIAALIC
jgi:hypothetical protein